MIWLAPYFRILFLFPLSTDPFKPFIIFSNRHEIRRIDLNKGEFSVLVPGLRNTIALDFHLNQSALYWTDVVEDKIYRGKLSENGGEALYCNRFLCLKVLKAPSLWFVLTIEGPLSFMPECTIFISENLFYLQLKTSGNWRSNCSALIRFSRILLS